MSAVPGPWCRCSGRRRGERCRVRGSMRPLGRKEEGRKSCANSIIGQEERQREREAERGAKPKTQNQFTELPHSTLVAHPSHPSSPWPVLLSATFSCRSPRPPQRNAQTSERRRCRSSFPSQKSLAPASAAASSTDHVQEQRRRQQQEALLAQFRALSPVELPIASAG